MARPVTARRSTFGRLDPSLVRALVPSAMTQILLTGASGYVGSHLARRAAARAVGACARSSATRAPSDLPADVEPRKRRRGHGHRPARGARRRRHRLLPDPLDERRRRTSPRRDRAAAVNFGEAAREAGVERVVYLGGLGPTGPDASAHLRSRHEVAQLLAQRGRRPSLRARGDGDRPRQRLVRDAAPPRRPAAADDHPALDRHPLAAGGDRRRRAHARRRGRARPTRRARCRSAAPRSSPTVR